MMGQAKLRGNYEQRKAKAIERDKHKQSLKTKLEKRRLLPKDMVLITAITALAEMGE